MLSAAQIAWHRDQYDHPKRSVVRLAEFVASTVGDSEPPREILDAATGAGANMLHLAGLFPRARWTGVDLASDLIQLGREHLDEPQFTLIESDLLRLERDLGRKRFDACFSIMVLSWIDDYERAIEQMLAVTRDWVFIMNLFSDTDVDAFVQITGRMTGASKGLSSPYNVYSLPRFREFCLGLGIRDLIAQPFEIDIDLPRPTHGGMGTWTQMTVDGKRLQISGPMLMPWWFVALRL